MKNTNLFLCLASTLAASGAGAYELATHSIITYNAYTESRLAQDSSLLKDLGLDALVVDPNNDNFFHPFGHSYYDVQGSTVSWRGVSNFEAGIIEKALNASALNIPGWLMRGAIREDDGGYAVAGQLWKMGLGAEPYDDPYGDINRFCNHFLDPLNGSGATFPCPGLPPLSAMDWALDASDSRRNHFTIADAREAMYRALTGKTKDGSSAGLPIEGVRQAYWATVFRALGDVVHLNQDMAQPQHTRNESHAGIGSGLGLNIAGDPVYEKYIDARALREKTFRADGTFASNFPGLTYTGYAIPRFNSYQDYWSSGTGTASLNGKGLANYSNRGFLTIDNNIGNTRYADPPTDASAYTRVQAPYPPGAQPLYLATYLTREVKDTHAPSRNEANVKLTRESAWKAFALSGSPYSMDRNVFDDMARLLIPRAVAYSAGLIDYFFRGKMEISLPEDGVYGIADHSKGVGFEKIKLRVANATPDIVTSDDISHPQAMSGGTLVAVARYHVNTCYQPDLSGEWGSPGRSKEECRAKEESIRTSKTTLNGAGNPVTLLALGNTPQEFQFIFDPPIPFGISDLYLEVVYRGSLGSEADAVVVANKDVTEPAYLSFFNATDYLYCVNGTWYRNNPDGTISSAASAAVTAAGGTPPTWPVRSTEGPLELAVNPLAFGDQTLPFTPVATVPTLAPGHFVRFAILGDREKIPFYSPLSGWIDSPGAIEPGTQNAVVGLESVQTPINSFRGSNVIQYSFAAHGYGGNASCINAASTAAIDNTNPTLPTLISADPITSYLP